MKIGTNLLAAVKNREFVASDKSCCHARSTDGIDIVETVVAASLRGKNIKLVSGSIDWADCQEEHAAALPLYQSHGAYRGLQ